MSNEQQAEQQVGALAYWNPELVEQVVLMYLHGDEVERALWILDNLPSVHRDHPPENLRKLKERVLGAMITPHAYMSSGLDAEVKLMESAPLLQNLLRGRLILSEVQRYNKNRLTPHIVDVGPGEYFVPLGLKAMDLEFTYWDVAMDQNTQKVAHPAIGGRRVTFHGPEPRIFVALEIIEHLPDPRDLAVEAVRHCGRMPERIHLSTPLYCYDGNVKKWDKPCGLPHLRTYTPKEFLSEADRIFPGYSWTLYVDRIMSLRGQRNDTVDPKPILDVGGKPS